MRTNLEKLEDFKTSYKVMVAKNAAEDLKFGFDKAAGFAPKGNENDIVPKI